MSRQKLRQKCILHLCNYLLYLCINTQLFSNLTWLIEFPILCICDVFQSQIAQLLQAGGRHADRERIAHLEQSLACSQCDIKSRNEKIAELEQKVTIFFFTSVQYNSNDLPLIDIVC